MVLEEFTRSPREKLKDSKKKIESKGERKTKKNQNYCLEPMRLITRSSKASQKCNS